MALPPNTFTAYLTNEHGSPLAAVKLVKHGHEDSPSVAEIGAGAELRAEVSFDRARGDERELATKLRAALAAALDAVDSHLAREFPRVGGAA